MPITINGTGTVTGISAGGLPDGVITTDDIAANAVTLGKIGTTEQGQLCKAWVNFNGTGVVAIRASFNVSSITDNGVGDYTVNFTTALADGNYSVSSTPGNMSGISNFRGRDGAVEWTTSACRLYSVRSDVGLNPTLADASLLTVAIFR